MTKILKVSPTFNDYYSPIFAHPKYEVWKPVIGFEGLYYISNHGRVFSMYRLSIIKPAIDKYKFLCLHKNKTQKKVFIHRLIAIHFIPHIDNKPVINHIDANKLNNDIANLEWCTQKENSIHASKMWLIHPGYVPGEKSGKAKLKDMQVIDIREMHKLGCTRPQISLKHGISSGCIGNIVKRRTWRHI